MNITLWVIASVLAALLLVSGAAKLLQPKEKLVGSAMGAALEGFGAGAIKAIGALEVLAAVGLVLPAALDIVPVLVAVAAVGVVLLMVGAMVTHARRREAQAVVVNVVLLALAAFVAWGRFSGQA